MKPATERFSKASALRRLEGRAGPYRVLPQYRLTRRQMGEDFVTWWRSAPDWVRRGALILRSNHALESLDGRQHAGRFRSEVSVPPDARLVRRAAKTVFESYAKGGPGKDLLDDLFLQPMIVSARWSGVVASRDRESGAPYFVIEESTGVVTDRVTGGQAGDVSLTRWPHWRPSAGRPVPRHVRLVEALHEVAEALALEELELEYAFGSQDVPIVLQVRPLAFHPPATSDGDFRRALERTRRDAGQWWSTARPGVGRRLFSVMADWNPAEILGRKPKPLSVSLYRACFTDRVWTEARQTLGYADPGRGPLMRLIGGTPYIDVERSFHSLVPAGTPIETARSLVAHWMEQLSNRPERHDSVELQIIHTAFTVATPGVLERYSDQGLQAAGMRRFEHGLRRITRRMLDPGGELEADLHVLDRWLNGLGQGNGSGEDDAGLPELLEECRAFAAPLFVRLARFGYAATAQLEALVDIGALPASDRDRLFRSVRPLQHWLKASECDARAISAHLRPSTYDIESPCWRQRPDWMAGAADIGKGPGPSHALSPSGLNRVGDALAEADWPADPAGFLVRCVRAIEGREAGKFLFSHHLSCLLERIALLGGRLGLSRGRLAMLELDQALELEASSTAEGGTGVGLRARLASLTDDAERKYLARRAIAVPDLLAWPDQVLGFTQRDPAAHYLGRGVIEGPVVRFSIRNTQSMGGAIVILESADPGHDFLFRLGVAAIVTCYGGINSHMAVRCRESGIPGVLGVGPVRFGKLRNASHLLIDMESCRMAWRGNTEGRSTREEAEVSE